jgi:hypothetical protein
MMTEVELQQGSISCACKVQTTKVLVAQYTSTAVPLWIRQGGLQAALRPNALLWSTPRADAEPFQVQNPILRTFHL